MTVARGALPHLPRRIAEVEHVRQFLVLLEGVHAPELIGRVSDDFIFRDQSLKWLHDQLLARSYVVKNLFSEYEKAGIDPYVGFPHALDAFY
jgi:hypothetical protein